MYNYHTLVLLYTDDEMLWFLCSLHTPILGHVISLISRRLTVPNATTMGRMSAESATVTRDGLGTVVNVITGERRNSLAVPLTGKGFTQLS